MASALASRLGFQSALSPLATKTSVGGSESRSSFAGASSRRCRLQIVSMAGGGGIETDLKEEQREWWRTAGEEAQADNTYPYGKVDGAHSWHKGDDGTLTENWKQAVEDAGGPSSPGQKAIAWLFLPGFFTILALGYPAEYYIGYTILFLFAYIGIEMGKPSKPSHFEPDVYRLKK